MKLTTTLLLAIAALTSAQNCYFPNGDVAPDSVPCVPDNSTSFCCPANWECLSNGLCFYDAQNYYGRYSCTDRNWSSDSCPGYCTQDNTANGNEAILHCMDQHWCCDGNRSSNCCSDDAAEVIDVPSGTSITMITDAPSPSSVGLVSSTSSPAGTSTTSTTSASSSSASSKTSSPSLQAPAAKPTTITTQAATTNSQGVATTITFISTAIQTPSPQPASNTTQPKPTKAHSNAPLIAGLAIAIPIALILAALALFFFYRRRHNRNEPKPSTSTTASSDLKYMYNNTTPDGQPPEIDSYPVAVAGTKPGHMSQVSELSGSEPKSPAVSSLSSPYSPQTKNAPGFGGAGGGLGQVQEEGEGLVELSAGDDAAVVQRKDFAGRTSYPGYVPYRPNEGGDAVRGEEGESGQSQAGAPYVAYRPPGEGEGERNTTAGTLPEDPVSPPQSPRSDFDHGQLGVGGLRIANQ